MNPIMLLIIVGIVLLVFLLGFIFMNYQSNTVTQFSGIQNDVNKMMQTYKVPGVIVAVSSPTEGIYILKKGLSNIQKNIPIDINTTWPIRSITKSFTVYLLLMLASEGKISLDDPVDKYVKGFPNGNIITLRQLAYMSAGISDYITSKFTEDFSKNPNKIFTLNELNSYIERTPLFNPGNKHIYINANTNILGAVIEKVTGRSIGEVLETKILKPFGLNDTKYVTDVRNINDGVTGYQIQNETLKEQPNNMSIFGPSGSMISTLPDLLVWSKILVNGYLLSPEINKTRFIADKFDQGPEYDRYGLGIGELNPSNLSLQGYLPFGMNGWWGHTGDGNGVTLLMMYNKEKNMSMVIFMNISNVVVNGVKTHLPPVVIAASVITTLGNTPGELTGTVTFPVLITILVSSDLIFI